MACPSALCFEEIEAWCFLLIIFLYFSSRLVMCAPTTYPKGLAAPLTKNRACTAPGGLQKLRWEAKASDRVRCSTKEQFVVLHAFMTEQHAKMSCEFPCPRPQGRRCGQASAAQLLSAALRLEVLAPKKLLSSFEAGRSAFLPL